MFIQIEKTDKEINWNIDKDGENLDPNNLNPAQKNEFILTLQETLKAMGAK